MQKLSSFLHVPVQTNKVERAKYKLNIPKFVTAHNIYIAARFLPFKNTSAQQPCRWERLIEFEGKVKLHGSGAFRILVACIRLQDVWIENYTCKLIQVQWREISFQFYLIELALI